MTLTCIMVKKQRNCYLQMQIHWLCLRLTSKFFIANVTKSEKSNSSTLTWPVTSSVTCRSIFATSLGSSRAGLSNDVWILEIDLVFWKIIVDRTRRYDPDLHRALKCRASRIRASTCSQSLHSHYLKTLEDSWEAKSTRNTARLFCSSTQSYAICLNDA